MTLVTAPVPEDQLLWPASVQQGEGYASLRTRLAPWLADCAHRCRIGHSRVEDLCRAYLRLAARVVQVKDDTPLVLGVNGAQGSGKSTLSAFLRVILEQGYGHRVAVFSIDDLYKTRAERERLAAEVHPLLATRGVPGTHDVELGEALLDALLAADSDTLTRMPSFDKARDDRAPETDWASFRGRPDVIVFDGWCVGAKPQPESALRHPVNRLEESEDPDGGWRRYVNIRLATDYARLFARLDKLVMLHVPGLRSVYEWRALQEAKLAAATVRAVPARTMTSYELARFIMHYERLTLWMLQEMPGRADVVLYLDEHHRFTHLGVKHPL